MPGLYVHIPFCEHKCVYCDFYSIAPTEERLDEHTLQATFTERVITEIGLRGAESVSSEPYDTVFFGGGTPSLLDQPQLSGILGALRTNFPVRSDAEITLEANPGTVSGMKLRQFREAGFTRVSFGVQSFDEKELRFLTRIHSGEQAEQSFLDARAAGFDNVSIDLMFGLPEQTLSGWMETLERALALAPDHISCYSLTVEPNTPLARMVSSGSVSVLDRRVDADLYEGTIDVLSAAGYTQYEVSNFCRPGMESKHNLNYWNHGEYLGFGPSAHSYQNGVRWWNIANLSSYTERLGRGVLPVDGEERLTSDQLCMERIFLSLRGPGLDLDRFARHFGASSLEDRRARIDALVQDGLAAVRGTMLALTRRGYLVCDEICASLA